MALTTGTPQSSSDAGNTPTVDTAVVCAIRAGIEPRTRWWQFELRPWHYWTALGSAAVLFVAFVALIATTGAVR